MKNFSKCPVLIRGLSLALESYIGVYFCCPSNMKLIRVYRYSLWVANVQWA